jgi:hypothetical protein
MKKSSILSLIMLTISIPFFMSWLNKPAITADDLQGAWEYTGEKNKTVRINAGRYFAEGTFDKQSNAFVAARGGLWRLEGKELIDTDEFNTLDADKIGAESKISIALKEKTLQVKSDGKTKNWKMLDNGKPGALHGAWLFTGRKDGDELKPYTPGVRKTMKILSGTRFQWAAYNTETKQFSGTGGGTYSTVDGKYVENIDFFSRDNSRVGASLNFDFNLQGDTWHHSGLSSKGDPLYELWSKRETIAGH